MDSCGRYRRGRRGIALIMVLGVMAVLSVMTLHLVVITEVSAREAKVASTRTDLRYAAESALSRAYWMWLADRAAFPVEHRNMAMPPTDRTAMGAEDAWRADGSVHRVDHGESTVSVRVLDADTGMDLSGRGPRNSLKTLLDAPEDPERQELVTRFLDQLGDYMDVDDLPRLNGMESADFEADGYPDLPRSGPLQYREEAFWLPGFLELFAEGGAVGTEELRILPPSGRKFPSSSKPSFFSASSGTIGTMVNLDDLELEAVIEARRRALDEGISLLEALDPALYSRLVGKFSLGESGVVTIVATARDASGQIARSLTMTRESRPDNLRDRLSGALQIVNWQGRVE